MYCCAFVVLVEAHCGDVVDWVGSTPMRALSNNFISVNRVAVSWRGQKYLAHTSTVPAGRALGDDITAVFTAAPALAATESRRLQCVVSVAAEITIDFPSLTTVSTIFFAKMLLKVVGGITGKEFAENLTMDSF